jgi:hypothetical protein
MKAATKLLIRRLAREEEARRAVASVRRPGGDPAPVVRTGENSSLRLPFTYTPYRLQAADRWWRESSPVTAPERKRRQR